MLKHKKLTLQDSFEYTGLWWLPEEPDQEIGGTLSYSPSEGIHLNLLGTFNPAFPFGNISKFELDVVNGMTSNGIPCTLFSNTQIGYSTAGFKQQKLASDLLILGHHYQSFDELVFSKWKICFEYLDDWIAPNLFDQSYSNDTEGTPMITVVAKPENYFDEYIDALEGRIVLTTEIFSGDGATSGDFGLSKDAFFMLEPKSVQPYEQFRRWLADIRTLLSLLMVESIQPRKIHGFLSKNVEDDHPAILGISIFPWLRNRPILRRTRRTDMLMTFGDIEGHLATALEHWLDAEFNVRQAVFLFFADTNPRSIDLDTQFVNIMHALESYHRSISEGHYLSVEAYQPFLEMMVQAIPEGINPDHRQALKSRLKFGYQYSQRKRFQELFDSLSANLQELVTSDVADFIKEVVDTRNYLVHRDESSKGLTVEWPDRAFAYYRLRMLMIILFLKYIGLDDETIHQHVSKNRRLRQFIGGSDEEE